MSQIIINGQPLYQVDLPEMTLAEYNALPVAERPKEWIRTDAEYTDIPAENVSYDNTSSGLTASNVQDAIDEITTADTGYSFENGTDYSQIQTVYSNSITKMGKLGFVSFGIALKAGLSHSVSYNIFDFPSGLEPASNLSVLAKSTNNTYIVSIDTDGKLTIVSFENVSSVQNVAVSLVYPIQ